MSFPSYATCRCGDVYVASHANDRACDECATTRRAAACARDVAAAARRAAYRAPLPEAAPYVSTYTPGQIAALLPRVIHGR